MNPKSERLLERAREAYRREDYQAALQSGMKAWDAEGRLDARVGDVLWDAFARWRWGGKGFTADRGYAVALEIFERLERARVDHLHLLPDLEGVDPFGPEFSHLRVHLGGRASWGWWALEYARSVDRRVAAAQRDAEARRLAPRVHEAVASLDYPMRATDVYHWLGELYEWYGLPFPDWPDDHMIDLERERRTKQDAAAPPAAPSTPTASSTSPTPAAPAGFVDCWKCGRTISADVETCPFCGGLRPSR